jgi:hypothetical protein
VGRATVEAGSSGRRSTTPRACALVTQGTSGLALKATVLVPLGPLDGEVLIDATGTITCVDASCSGARGYASATQIACTSAVVSPGFVNAHDHTDYDWTPPATDAHGTVRYQHRVVDWTMIVRVRYVLAAEPAVSARRNSWAILVRSPVQSCRWSSRCSRISRLSSAARFSRGRFVERLPDLDIGRLHWQRAEGTHPGRGWHDQPMGRGFCQESTRAFQARGLPILARDLRRSTTSTTSLMALGRMDDGRPRLLRLGDRSFNIANLVGRLSRERPVPC